MAAPADTAPSVKSGVCVDPTAIYQKPGGLAKALRGLRSGFFRRRAATQNFGGTIKRVPRFPAVLCLEVTAPFCLDYPQVHQNPRATTNPVSF
jgi:hypothetical protein